MTDTRTDWPHVTAILRDAGLTDTGDAVWFRDFDLARGSAVHAASQYLDEGDLDWSTVDPVVLPRLRQYQRFLDEVRPRILATEEHVEHAVLRYQGRLDRRIAIGSELGVLDIKGPSRAAWHPIQLAAYAAALGGGLRRWNLYLADDRYQLVEHRDRNDWEVFKAALTIVNWKNGGGK